MFTFFGILAIVAGVVVVGHGLSEMIESADQAKQKRAADTWRGTLPGTTQQVCISEEDTIIVETVIDNKR